MKILVIAQHLPYPPDTGGKIRHFHLYSRLAQRHHLTWISPVVTSDAPYLRDVLRFCDQLIPLPDTGVNQLPTEGWRNILMRAVAHLHWNRLFEFCFGYVNIHGLCWVQGTPERRVLVQETFDSSAWDIVICESIGSVELVPHAQTTPRLVSLFDIQTEIFRRLRQISPWTLQDRLFYIPELLKVQRYERQHYRRFDAAIAVSQHDKALLNQLCAGLQTTVIDNGVDTTYYQPCLGSETENCLAFVGSYSYPPNKDAVVYFAQKILPRIRAHIPDATFFIIGKDAPAELGQVPGVSVIGTVPDVRPFLQQASVVVVPLRAGSGTRLKILEAMAAGKPVVTTSVGMEGLRVRHGIHLMVADEPDDFTAAVIRLLRDSRHRREIGTNARKLVEQEYGWSMLAQRFEAVILDTVRRNERPKP